HRRCFSAPALPPRAAVLIADVRPGELLGDQRRRHVDAAHLQGGAGPAVVAEPSPPRPWITGAAHLGQLQAAAGDVLLQAHPRLLAKGSLGRAFRLVASFGRVQPDQAIRGAAHGDRVAVDDGDGAGLRRGADRDQHGGEADDGEAGHGSIAIQIVPAMTHSTKALIQATTPITNAASVSKPLPATSSAIAPSPTRPQPTAFNTLMARLMASSLASATPGPTRAAGHGSVARRPPRASGGSPRGRGSHDAQVRRRPRYRVCT